jgi:hypothetical protein
VFVEYLLSSRVCDGMAKCRIVGYRLVSEGSATGGQRLLPGVVS